MASDAVRQLHLPPMRKVLTRAEALSASPFIAYGIIIALQLRVIWHVWRYKDLIFGDTASYFVDAVSWTHGLHDDIIWSPLYTDFWGTVLAVFKGNAYDSEMACRVAIVLAAS